jgi:hypothetical protein
MISQYFLKLKPDPIIAAWISLVTFLGLEFRTIINYAPYPLSWDEAYYLHRAVCMNQAVYSLSWSRVTDCLAGTHKGPIVELLGLPWGSVGGTYGGVGLTFVALGLFVWILALLTYLVCIRGGIPVASLLLGAAAIGLTPSLRLTAGAMMTETLLG